MADPRKLLKELEETMDDNRSTSESLKEVADTIIDQNEELIATYVEGAQRTIKATKENSTLLEKNTKSVNFLSKTVASNTVQTKKGLESVQKAIQDKETNFDTSQIEDKLDKLNKKEVVFPKKASEPIPVRLSDGKKFIKGLVEANKTASNMWFGGGGGRVPTKGIAGNEYVQESSGIGLPFYDYVSMTLSGGDTTETYTFKQGGSGGTTVATIAVVYTNSDRDVLSTVTKT